MHKCNACPKRRQAAVLQIYPYSFNECRTYSTAGVVLVPAAVGVAVGYDAQLRRVVEDPRVRRHGLREEHVAADDAAAADGGLAAEDGGAGIDGDVVLDVGVAFYAFDGVAVLVLGEAECAEGDALVELHVVADDGGSPMTTPVPWSMKKRLPILAPGWMSMPVLLCAARTLCAG